MRAVRSFARAAEQRLASRDRGAYITLMDAAELAALNALMRPPMLCVCRRVPEADIRRAVEQGADTFEKVQALTRCSTGCGTCEGRVRELVERIRPLSPRG